MHFTTVTFYPIQPSAWSPQQKDFLATLELLVKKTIFWNCWFSQDAGGWAYLLVYGIPFLDYCTGMLCHYEHSTARPTQYSYIHKHSKTPQLTEKHDEHVLQLTANCN